MAAIIFSRSAACPQLYLAGCDSAPAGGQQVAFLLPRGASGAPPTIDLPASWAGYPSGCYLFLPSAIADDQQAAFASAAWSYLGDRSRVGARFAWIENPAGANAGLRGAFIALYQVGAEWRTDRLTRFDFGGITILVGKGCPLSLAQDGSSFSMTQPAPGSCAIQAPSGERHPIDGELVLPICGADSGCLQFAVTLKNTTLPATLKDLDVGLRIFVKDTSFPAADDQFFVTSLRYPVFSEDPGDWARYGGDLTLYADLDPLGQLDEARTSFSLVGPTGAGPAAMPSCYRTNIGYTVHLTPRDRSSRLVFARKPAANGAGGDDRYYLMPAGEFAMTVPRYAEGASQDPHDYDDNLLCGLSGVEYIKLEPSRNNLLCFRTGRPAFVPGFVLGTNATANGAEALTDLATTAWAYVRQSDGVPIYYAQPDQAVLYKPDTTADTTSPQGGLLSYMEVPAATLSDHGDAAFPLFPYGGVRADPEQGIALADYRQIELQRLVPIRRARIHELGAAQPQPFRATLDADGGTVTGTTPQGLLATFADQYATIATLLLARDTAGVDVTFERIERDTPLRSALQSNQLFLVISDPDALAPYFKQNKLTIQEWIFDLDPANWAEHGTLLIFKFHDKPLARRDADTATWTLAELTADTQMWALPKEFNGRPEATRRRLAALVLDALARTADDAPAKDRENYAQLARAASDPNWSGIIALNVALSAIPQSLGAISGGIDRTKFYAQYVGVEATPITPQNGQLMAGQSSLFGLIDYRDDAAPLPSDSGYNFQVTRLQALFQNSHLKAFSSDVSVTLDKLFDEPTRLIDSPTGRNIVVFKGTAEDHDGHTTYAFSFSGDNRFALPESHVLNEVEIIKAQFATDPPSHAQPALIVGRFTFWGRLNFRQLAKFDVLSFGAEDAPVTGPSENYLSFSNLVVTMAFTDNRAESGDQTMERTFAFDPRNLAFDMQRSQARPGSLFAKFPLKFTGLLYSAGDDDKKLDDYGYMPVKTPLGGGKIAGAAWYGLRFDLDLGSAGALAGKAGLVASILAAWSPGKQTVFVGLRLPGSSGGKREIAIQGVLKIVFKGIEFVVGDTGGQASYLLKLKNIQLKFLVLSIPPSGQTEIIIFGDPQGTAESNTVGWYAAYAKEPPPPTRPPSQLPGV